MKYPENLSKPELINENKLLRDKVKKLEKTEKQFRIIAENTSDNIAITTFDLKAKYLYVSPSVKQVLDYDPKDLLGKSFFDFIHPDDKIVLLPLIKKYIKLIMGKVLRIDDSEISETIEFRFRDKAGNWHYMQSAINFIEKNILAVTRDITKYKQANEALQESEEKFRAISESAIDSIFIKDINLKYLHVNPAMIKLFGLSESNLIGKTDIELFGEEIGKLIVKLDKRVIKGEIITDEQEKSVEGKLHSFHAIKVPLKNSEGKIIGVCGIARDITEKKQAEEELAKHREHLEELVKERTVELEEKNKELKRYNKLFEGRELRIKDLRDKVKELEGKLGRSI